MIAFFKKFDKVITRSFIFFSYNSNGYLVSPTVITPNGQYYQFGLPPLHGHQPVYQIPPSPQHCYETDTTYMGHCTLPPPSPMSPMSPMYQQPIYYSQPMFLNPNMAYPPPLTPTTTLYPPENVGPPVDVINNNNSSNDNDNNNNVISSIDAVNNNSNTLHPHTNSATTTVVPSSYGVGGVTSQQSQYAPVSSSSPPSVYTNTYVQGVPTESRPLVLNGKSTHTQNNNLAFTYGPVMNNSAPVMNNSAPVTNLSGANCHPGGNIVINSPLPPSALLHGGHPHIVGIPPQPHNGSSPTSFVPSSINSPTLQNQNQMFPLHAVPPSVHQGTYMQQPREIVQM